MARHTWQIVSPFMQRDLSFEDGKGLNTERWIHRRTGTNFLPQLSHDAPEWNMEFSFVINAQLANVTLEFCSSSTQFVIYKPVLEQALRVSPLVLDTWPASYGLVKWPYSRVADR